MHRHPPSLRRGGVPPHHRIVPRERARRVVRRPDDGQLAAAGEVDERAHLQGLLRGEDVGLDAERPVEQGLLALDLERIRRVAQVELALVGEQDVEVELLGERPVHPQARLVQGDGLGRVVVGAEHLGVATRCARAKVGAFEDGDVADAVDLREVVREREAVHAAADDHHVVAGPELALLEEPDLPQQTGHRSSSRAVGLDALAYVRRHHRGHEQIDPVPVDQDPHAHPGDLPDEGARHRELELGQAREGLARPRPIERVRAPAVRDVEHDRVRVQPHDRRRHGRLRNVADERDLAGRDAARAGEVAHPVARLGRGEHARHRRRPGPELSHGPSCLRGRRTGSARPGRPRAPLGARSGTRPGLAGSTRARSLDPARASVRPR